LELGGQFDRFFQSTAKIWIQSEFKTNSKTKNINYYEKF